jgi:hypothetical protein
MKFALYCEEEVVVEFPTEVEVWQCARANGLCSEEISIEELPPRRSLNPRYVIHTFASDGELIAMSRTRLSYVSESEW